MILLSSLGPPVSSSFVPSNSVCRKTQFAYQLMRCKTIFNEQPEPERLSVSLFPPHTFLFFSPPPVFFLSPSYLSIPICHARSIFSPAVSLHLEPRPLETLLRWIWSSQQSSGRRSTRRKRRRTGRWRRRSSNLKLNWPVGGTVIFAAYPDGFTCNHPFLPGN